MIKNRTALCDSRFIGCLREITNDINRAYLVRLVTGCGLAMAKKYLRKLDWYEEYGKRRWERIFEKIKNK